ncbi:jg21956 [Pararge aegeria aegeria]|uniref:Jg21956 protein n=1 Tax=Pararge aegeria aegeria TaxID=348720 RepID=A0A8S4SMI9_9NEOP|nr:jg21956 [Pararge aegeria aegeria]
MPVTKQWSRLEHAGRKHSCQEGVPHPSGIRNMDENVSEKIEAGRAFQIFAGVLGTRKLNAVYASKIHQLRNGADSYDALQFDGKEVKKEPN